MLCVLGCIKHFLELWVANLIHEAQTEPKGIAVALQKCNVFWIFGLTSKKINHKMLDAVPKTDCLFNHLFDIFHVCCAWWFWVKACLPLSIIVCLTNDWKSFTSEFSSLCTPQPTFFCFCIWRVEPKPKINLNQTNELIVMKAHLSTMLWYTHEAGIQVIWVTNCPNALLCKLVYLLPNGIVWVPDRGLKLC